MGPTTTKGTEKEIKKLNELLRGEISALETYNQVMEKVDGEVELEKIREIKSDHAKAVGVLREYIESKNHLPTTDSGAWGVWAKTITGAAKIFGEKSALKALKEGEEHGVKEYEEALADPDLDMDIKEVIRSQLLRAQQDHIRTIDAFLA